MLLKYVLWTLLSLIYCSKSFALESTITTAVSSENVTPAGAIVPSSAPRLAAPEPPPANEKIDALQAQIDSLQKQFKDLKPKEITPPQSAAQETQVKPMTLSVPAAPISENKKAAVEIDNDQIHLRRRIQSFNWNYSYEYFKLKNKSAGSSGAYADGNTTNMGIEYSRNLSFWEAGLFLAALTSKVDLLIIH